MLLMWRRRCSIGRWIGRIFDDSEIIDRLILHGSRFFLLFGL